MKNAPIQSSNESAPKQANFNPSQAIQSELFEQDCQDKSPSFSPGNPRHMRVGEELLTGGLWRCDVDAIAGAANGPQLMADIGVRNVHWTCTRYPKLDRDGLECKPGFYELTDLGRQMILERLELYRQRVKS